jgi:hypothetical protein
VRVRVVGVEVESVRRRAEAAIMQDTAFLNVLFIPGSAVPVITAHRVLGLAAFTLRRVL